MEAASERAARQRRSCPPTPVLPAGAARTRRSHNHRPAHQLHPHPPRPPAMGDAAAPPLRRAGAGKPAKRKRPAASALDSAEGVMVEGA